MVESRCGLKCSECSYVESHGCKGCLTGGAFYGSCRVSDCCTKKEVNHCGLCKEFPCELLDEFAYDEEQGDNGQRIETMKEWINNL